MNQARHAGAHICVALGVLFCAGDRPGKGAAAAALEKDGWARTTTLRPLAWISEGRQLVLLRLDQLALVDVGRVLCDSTGLYVFEGGRVHSWRMGADLCDHWWHIEDGQLSRDGRRLLYADEFQEGGIFVLDLDKGAVTRLLANCLPISSAPAWSPDEGRIAFISDCHDAEARGTLHLAGGDASDPRPISLGQDTVREDDPSWAPDGRRLTLVRGDGAPTDEILVVDTATKTRISIARGTKPTWSPTGDWIAYLQPASNHSWAHSIRAVRPDGSGDHELVAPDHDGDTGELAGHRSGPTRPIWAPSGDYVVFGRGASLWLVKLTGTPQRLFFQPGN